MRPARRGSGWQALAEAQIDCMVAAPSKLHPPGGDRAKTDARDAAHLARLLRLGEIIAVAGPEAEVEAARDLVRAREDARADLMRVRHRLSKLLLRQGSGVLGRARLDRRARDVAAPPAFRRFPTPRLAFETALTRCSSATARRDRLDEPIDDDGRRTASSGRCGATGWGACAVSRTLTGFALAVEIGDWHRFTGASIGAYVGLVPTRVLLRGLAGAGLDHQDRQRPRAAAADRGRMASPGRPTQSRPTMRDRWAKLDPARHGPGARGQPAAAPARGAGSPSARSSQVVANVAIARELAGWCWSLADHGGLTGHASLIGVEPSAARQASWTRVTTMSSLETHASSVRRSTLESSHRSLPNHRLAVPNPRISV